ncbi:MAG: oxidative damage protection protein [Betaproteobacteria bacterium]|nr:oxidative damage protection protein [Betaproteobacteria bacterium]
MRTVHCIKLNKEAEGLDFPPYPGDLGQKIYQSVSKEAWQGWVKHQTMLVNENRLNLADLRARKYLAQQMESYFFSDNVDQPAGYVPPAGFPDFKAGARIQAARPEARSTVRICRSLRFRPNSF